ncbi:hypothetical protein HGRIS_006194 [Hohenbuehelia grisea]|uniref:tRNA-splicing endonuclease subunit Sen54 N-terminal domain-containing protein n=1 Tax=Hohenbuehelia grisea TaxID=104357 RepID=A0ABR3K1T5_9AGAR
MDDAFEDPNVAPKPPADRSNADAEEDMSDGDEDGGADWTKLPSAGAARPVIPRRGEKEFEPAAGGGSGLQLHVLDRARLAMFNALKATRTTSSKAISYAVWYPELARAHITLARGIHFTAMGHSAQRPAPEGEKLYKRLELLPEEAIYLIERGSLFCWKATEGVSFTNEHKSPEDVGGSPMSVQQAYSEMTGTEDLTLEKFQVYAYLRRLGYVVTRAVPPTSDYPSAAPFRNINSKPLSLWDRIFGRILGFCGRMTSRIDWWKPLCLSNWRLARQGYSYIYNSLRLIPSGYDRPLHSFATNSAPSPYQVFYNLYKPVTAFKKSSPPEPDFSVVVINARTTPMPTLFEISSLFDEMPELPIPMPRQRQLANTPQIKSTPAPPQPPKSTFGRVFSWIFSRGSQTAPPIRRPNPFMVLKAGKKIVVIAVVDSGNISFFRFGQGAFDEWPMFPI